MNKSLIINHASDDYKENTLAFISDFLHSEKPKFLFGKNVFVEKIIEQVSIDGIIDERTEQNSYKNIPITKLGDIPKNALVLVLSGGSPIVVLNKLSTRGIRHLHYFAFYKYSNLKLQDIPFEGAFDTEYIRHKEKFSLIYDKLKDQQSKQEFEKVINFRFSLDLKYMQDFTTREDEQYFEEFLQLENSGEAFVDVGAYDGFTSESFIELCSNFRSIDIFEPEIQNLTAAKKRLAQYDKIFFHKLGLSDKKGHVYFSAAGSTSSISTTGTERINIDTLDNVLTRPVSFIKMDIEGAELSALNGAEKTIKNNHPRIAIAVYHSPEHIWKIPEKILSIREDYDIYFRHYTQSIYESVMFFIPK